MNNCQHIKDLILTDYIDGQLGGPLKSQVEEHLQQCPSCQTFAREVKEQVVTPFTQLPAQEVPVHVWQGIKDRIQDLPQADLSLAEKVKSWLEGFSFPRLVPVLGAFVFAVAITFNVVLNNQMKQTKEQEQGFYLASVLLSDVGPTTTDSDDLETPIETYFL